jgi:hypothetical protein
MKTLLAFTLVVTLAGLGLATDRAEAQAFLECINGTSFRDGAPARLRCASRNGAGVSIDVEPSDFAYEDNPACGTRSVDGAIRFLLSSAAAQRSSTAEITGSNFRAFWDRLKARVSRSSELGDLMTGVSRTRGASRCQAFVVPVNASPRGVLGVEFRASQQGRQGACFSARLTLASPRQLAERERVGLQPPAGDCAIGWSGWQGGAYIADGQGGTIVGAVFKNWSHTLTRTAEVWVWY